jgi:hypothetical protein
METFPPVVIEYSELAADFLGVLLVAVLEERVLLEGGSMALDEDWRDGVVVTLLSVASAGESALAWAESPVRLRLGAIMIVEGRSGR